MPLGTAGLDDQLVGVRNSARALSFCGEDAYASPYMRSSVRANFDMSLKVLVNLVALRPNITHVR